MSTQNWLAVTSDGDGSTDSSVDEGQSGFDYVKLSTDIFIVVDPLILVTGVVGNVLLVAVMRRKSLKNTSVSVYMIALAAADLLVLILDFINNWFKLELDLKLLAMSDSFCKFHRFFFNVCYTYSAWLVVSVAIEKFIAVWFPFRAKALCTRRNAVIVVCTLPVPIVCLYLNNLWAWSVRDGECDMLPEWVSFMSNVAPWLSAAFYSYIPIVALLCLNSAIIYKLYSWKAQWQGMGTSDKSKSQEAAERKVTITVVIICVFYIILTLPVALFYIIMYGAGEFVNAGPELALAENIILLLGLCNHGINFFLYVVSSGKFRAELKVMLRSIPGCGYIIGPVDRASSKSTVTGMTSVSINVPAQ